MKRLASGRLMLVWNRPFPEGKDAWPLSGGDGIWSDTPVSNHREELSLAFSDDDGRSWSKPVAVAGRQGQWVSYPYIFEIEPGRLWLTTMQGGLRDVLSEDAFVSKQGN